jgi:ribosomal protein S27AE
MSGSTVPLKTKTLFLWNITNHAPNDTALHARRLVSTSAAPLWEQNTWLCAQCGSLCLVAEQNTRLCAQCGSLCLVAEQNTWLCAQCGYLCLVAEQNTRLCAQCGSLCLVAEQNTWLCAQCGSLCLVAEQPRRLQTPLMAAAAAVVKGVCNSTFLLNSNFITFIQLHVARGSASI